MATQSTFASVALCLVALSCVNRSMQVYQVTMRVDPAVVPADGTTPILAMVSIANNAGNPGGDLMLVFHSSNPNTIITQPTALTADGWYIASLRSTDPGTQTVTVGVTQGAEEFPLNVSEIVTFNPLGSVRTSGVPALGFSFLAAEPNVVSSDGVTTTLLTLHVSDAFGVPVQAASVTFTSSGSDNNFSTISGLTDVNGVLTTTFKPLQKTQTLRYTLTWVPAGQALESNMIESEHGSSLHAYAIRLHRGDDLRESLEAKVRENNIQAAVVMTCVGSVQKIDIRLADESLPGPLEGPFEIVSLVGTMGRGGSHLHASFADAKGNVMGGHVRPGCIVHTTAEVVLGVLPEVTFDRTFDAVTGFDELDIKPAK